MTRDVGAGVGKRWGAGACAGAGTGRRVVCTAKRGRDAEKRGRRLRRERMDESAEVERRGGVWEARRMAEDDALGLGRLARGSARGAERVVFATAESLAHTSDEVDRSHPESQRRVAAAVDALGAAGLLDPGRGAQVTWLKEWGWADGAVALRQATVEEVCAVHDAAAARRLEEMCEQLGRVQGAPQVSLLDEAPTYYTAASNAMALKAAGVGLSVLDAVVEASFAASADSGAPAAAGPVSPASGMALIRPPGHHAVPEGPMGFCLLNNVSIAVRHAQKAHGLRKVVVFDFDVHHGNGTADAFLEDPDVLVVSFHEDKSYPGTGVVEQVGRGAGEGTNINVNLPAGAGDKALSTAFHEILAPAVSRFGPELILCSAGYDGHWRDPLAHLRYTSLGFHTLAVNLRELAATYCGGRLVFFLEGGYDLIGLSDGVVNTFKALIGERPDFSRDEGMDVAREPMREVMSSIRQVKALHAL